MDQVPQLLKEHMQNHPGLELQDAVKFLYQSFLGPGHLIQDEPTALARLIRELDQVEADPKGPLYEPVGHGLCRLHLAACKGNHLSPQTLCRMFVLTAQEVKPDPAAFQHSLSLLETGLYPPEEVAAFLKDYRAQGYPPISHSATYRTSYAPAYRIVWERFAKLVPILAAIDSLLSTQPQTRVAIDGPCASGKTTLGQTLASLYRCPLFHMDDFFLRPEQRTPQRLGEPGGNVDYERFAHQILAPLCAGTPVHVLPWNCHEGIFGPERVVPPAPLALVEGSYSLHPLLQDQYHLRIWVEAPWSLREKRLLQRGGPDCLERFRSRWIPMEDRYFETFQIKKCCHITYSGI